MLIAIERRVAAVTVTAMAFEAIPFWDALMFADPTPCAVANPDAFTVKTLLLEEAHATELLIFWVLPSLKAPVAVNGSVVPLAIEALFALMVIDCSAAAVTVSVIEFDVMPFCVALIALLPAATPVANPAALTVATDAFDEFHVTELLRFCVLPSLNVPVAVNCAVVPFAMDVMPALMVIACRVGPAAPEALKLSALCEAPLMVTFWLAGENVMPVLVGVTVYAPSATLAKL